MIYVAISLSALALAASVAVAVWLIISSHRTRELGRSLSQTRSELQKLVESFNAANASVSSQMRALELKAPASLVAQVAELSDAVGRLGDTHRKFAGKVWAELGHARRDKVSNGDIGDPDGDLAAMLALQSAKPVGPVQ